MAKALPVISDVSSAEVDEMRRSFHALLVALQNVASEVDAGNITADEAFTVLLNTVSTGLDSDITGVDGGGNNYAGTGVVVSGVKPTPLHPRRARKVGVAALVDLDENSEF